MPHAGAKTHDGVRSRHLVCRPGELVLNPSQIPATGIMTHCQFRTEARPNKRTKTETKMKIFCFSFSFSFVSFGQRATKTHKNGFQIRSACRSPNPERKFASFSYGKKPERI